ncbi:MAG: PASTA domain-containing protein [Blautia sp.]
MRTVFAVCTTVGRIRKINQDNFYLNGITKQIQVQDISLEGNSGEGDQIFAVCDGMGGEESGEVAAFLAVEELKKYSKENFHREWHQYIESANDVICHYQDVHCFQTGTTFAGLYIHEGHAQAVNVGDSRIYLIRNGEIIQLSKDHTKFQTLVDAGFLTQEDFCRTNSHNYLIQSLGIDSRDMELDPFTSEIEVLQDQDVFLLCSDGLYSVLLPNEIVNIAMLEETAAIRSRKLVDLAEKKGSRDNITALLVCICMENKSIKTGHESFEDKISEKQNYRVRNQARGIPKQKKVFCRKNSVIRGAVGILLLLSIICFFYLWKNPEVPDVVGMDKVQAKQAMIEKGFLVDIIEVNTDTAEKGTVFMQSEEKKRVSRGSRICLTVSLGPESVKVPDVTGKKAVEAQNIMTESGFSVDIRMEYSNTVQEGCVIFQIPDANSELFAGNTVNITVSKGPERR